MKLKEGKMTTKELAEWFGVSYGGFRNTSESKYKALKAYADYEKIRGGVIIKHIYVDTYCKDINYKDNLIYLKEVKNSNNGLTTITGMTNKIYRDKEGELGVLELSTIKRRLTKAGKQGFGQYGDNKGGIYGIRTREWAIKEDNYGKIRPFTEEEKDIFDDLISNLYSKETDKIKIKASLEQQLRDKEMDVDEYFDNIDKLDIDLFSGVIKSFKVKTGKQVILATKNEIRAWENKAVNE